MLNNLLPLYAKLLNLMLERLLYFADDQVVDTTKII